MSEAKLGRNALFGYLQACGRFHPRDWGARPTRTCTFLHLLFSAASRRGLVAMASTSGGSQQHPSLPPAPVALQLILPRVWTRCCLLEFGFRPLSSCKLSFLYGQRLSCWVGAMGLISRTKEEDPVSTTYSEDMSEEAVCGLELELGALRTRAAGLRQGMAESLLEIRIGPAECVGCSRREAEEAPGHRGEVCVVASGCRLAGPPQPVHATCSGVRWAGAREGSRLTVQGLRSRFMICFACNPVSRLHNCNSETFTVSLT